MPISFPLALPRAVTKLIKLIHEVSKIRRPIKPRHHGHITNAAQELELIVLPFTEDWRRLDIYGPKSTVWKITYRVLLMVLTVISGVYLWFASY